MKKKNKIIGEYKMGKRIDRIGEERIMNCGLSCIVTDYHNSNDIDIRFENGEVVNHQTYRNFIIGNILPPSLKNKEYRSECRKKIRTGEERMMKCNMKAKIKDYRNSKDIDVEFEDGTVVEHRYYSNFVRGNVDNPNIRKNTKIGETKMMNCGMPCTITAYRITSDIDVRFEDGTEVFHKSYGCFKRGEIKNPNIYKSTHIGETKMMNCGIKCTIIRCGGCDDIDVEFENGTIRKHLSYGSFKDGKIYYKERRPSVKWTDEEIEILKNRYPANGMDIPELIEMGKLPQDILLKAFSLKLKKDRHCYDHFGNRYESIAELCKFWHITREIYSSRIGKMSKKEMLETPFLKIKGLNIKRTELFLDNKNKIFGNIYFCTCKKCNAPVTGWANEIASKKCPECGK